MNIAKRMKVFGPAFFKKLAVGKAEPYGLKAMPCVAKKETRDKAARARRAIGRRPGPLAASYPIKHKKPPGCCPGAFCRARYGLYTTPSSAVHSRVPCLSRFAIMSSREISRLPGPCTVEPLYQ